MNQGDLPPELASLPGSLIPLDGPVELVEAYGTGWRYGAVLVLLFPGSSGVHFPLTVRPRHLRSHPGQISLPGGKVEPEDPSLLDAALREAREELGVPTHRIRPLGRLETVSVRVTRFLLIPFVAWNPIPLSFEPEPREVEMVLDVPLSELLHPDSVRVDVWDLRESRWHVGFFSLQGHQVWGATAQVLNSLVHLLNPSEPGPGIAAPGEVWPL